MKETLRHRPVVPVVARRVREPVTLGGLAIPAGTVLMVSIYLLHRDPEVYPEPDEFRPERFLDGEPDPRAWVPFGGGVRRCLGASFATLEMKVVLRTALGMVRLRAVDPARRAGRPSPLHLHPGARRPRRGRGHHLATKRLQESAQASAGQARIKQMSSADRARSRTSVELSRNEQFASIIHNGLAGTGQAPDHGNMRHATRAGARWPRRAGEDEPREVLTGRAATGPLAQVQAYLAVGAALTGAAGALLPHPDYFDVTGLLAVQIAALLYGMTVLALRTASR